MKIKLSMILDQLKEYPYEYVEGTASDQLGFASVRLLKSSEQGFRSDVLYLGSAAVVQQLDPRHLPAQLICLVDSSSLFEIEKVQTIDQALIWSDCDIEVWLDKITDIISEYYQIYDEMIRRITDNKGLTEIINAMTPILGNPLYVADADFKVLARTDCVLKKPEEWRHIVDNGIEDGYISSSVNDFYYMKDLVLKTEHQHEPVFFSGNELYPHSFCTMNLTSRNKKIGLVTVFETEHPFSIGTKATIEFFSDILIMEIQKNQTMIINEGVKLGYLFAEILTGDRHSENELQKVIHYVNIAFPKPFFIMVFQSRHANRNRYELTFLRKKIIDLIDNTICIIHQNNIVMLANDQSSRQFFGQRLVDIEHWLQDSKMVAGISDDCCEITEIRKSYQTALTAIELGLKAEKKGLLFSYDRYRFSHLMDVIGHLENSNDLCHPALDNLRLYDEKKGANLVETLHCYMKNGRSQAQTAKELHLHRSSLQYRLTKMEEVMGVQLDHYQTFLHLQLTYEICKQ
ncbi:MAG: helix-turn-helix domain-containing protein [Firmicutes bacterium]|nr:helix-turn-helix domain-containing protein [Bacillota bacterium]